LLWTVQIRVDGNADSLRSAIDKMLAALQSRITEPSFIRLNRDADGIWFLSLGIAGPAVAVAEGWVVISFSPNAARQAVAAMAAIKSEE
jgi:hypothetical protein